MQIWKHVVRTATVIIMVSLIACATTPNLTGSWRDENYTGKFQNVLVVGISANQAARRIFEDTVVNSLKAKGVEASALFRVAPSDAEPDKDAIEAVVKEKSFAAVITTRVTGEDSQKRYVEGRAITPPPSYYSTMGGYVGAVGPVVYEPGYMVDEKRVSLESNGYDAASGKLVWTITTELFNPSDLNEEVKGLAGLIVRQLEGSDLI
jgi:type II secretory pathway pseudopilin PulG